MSNALPELPHDDSDLFGARDNQGALSSFAHIVAVGHFFLGGVEFLYAILVTITISDAYYWFGSASSFAEAVDRHRFLYVALDLFAVLRSLAMIVAGVGILRWEAWWRRVSIGSGIAAAAFALMSFAPFNPFALLIYLPSSAFAALLFLHPGVAREARLIAGEIGKADMIKQTPWQRQSPTAAVLAFQAELDPLAREVTRMLADGNGPRMLAPALVAEVVETLGTEKRSATLLMASLKRLAIDLLMLLKQEGEVTRLELIETRTGVLVREINGSNAADLARRVRLALLYAPGDVWPSPGGTAIQPFE
jgi:hypothetical protein